MRHIGIHRVRNNGQLQNLITKNLNSDLKKEVKKKLESPAIT